ncbi:MAG: hypothetical protein SFY69_10570 [Planctomycetota bacterium]|nr:hypothetical protein [Planctomycetota bacterium]
MTRSHRRWHLRAWLVLGPAAIVLLVAAVVSRARAEAALDASGAQRAAEGAP